MKIWFFTLSFILWGIFCLVASPFFFRTLFLSSFFLERQRVLIFIFLLIWVSFCLVYNQCYFLPFFNLSLSSCSWIYFKMVSFDDFYQISFRFSIHYFSSILSIWIPPMLWYNLRNQYHYSIGVFYTLSDTTVYYVLSISDGD